MWCLYRKGNISKGKCTFKKRQFQNVLTKFLHSSEGFKLFFKSVSSLTKLGLLLLTPLNSTNIWQLQKLWFSYFTFKIWYKMVKIVPFLILPFCEVKVDLGVAKLIYYNLTATLAYQYYWFFL